MSTMMDGFLWLGPTRVTDSPAHKGPCGLCPPNHPITIPPDTMVLIQLPKCSDPWCHLELTNPSPPHSPFFLPLPYPGGPVHMVLSLPLVFFILSSATSSGDTCCPPRTPLTLRDFWLQAPGESSGFRRRGL